MHAYSSATTFGSRAGTPSSTGTRTWTSACSAASAPSRPSRARPESCRTALRPPPTRPLISRPRAGASATSSSSTRTPSAARPRSPTGSELLWGRRSTWPAPLPAAFSCSSPATRFMVSQTSRLLLPTSLSWSEEFASKAAMRSASAVLLVSESKGPSTWSALDRDGRSGSTPLKPSQTSDAHAGHCCYPLEGNSYYVVILHPSQKSVATVVADLLARTFYDGSSPVRTRVDALLSCAYDPHIIVGTWRELSLPQGL